MDRPSPSDLAARLDAWSGGTVLGPLPGGARSRLWRVRLASGRDAVARATRDAGPAAGWLLPVLAAARRAGLTVAMPIPSASGALVRGGITLEPYVPGDPGTLADLAALAPAVARFHRLTRRIPPRPGHPPLAAIAAGWRAEPCRARRLARRLLSLTRCPSA